MEEHKTSKKRVTVKKLALLGDVYVGKTSIAVRYAITMTNRAHHFLYFTGSLVVNSLTFRKAQLVSSFPSFLSQLPSEFLKARYFSHMLFKRQTNSSNSIYGIQLVRYDTP